MKSVKIIPKHSIIGFLFVMITVIVSLSFTIASDIGMKIVLSSFSSMLLIFTPLWVIMGIREFRFIIKQISKLKTNTDASPLEQQSINKRHKNLKVCLVINIIYLMTIVLQIGYVILNWDQIIF